MHTVEVSLAHSAVWATARWVQTASGILLSLILVCCGEGPTAGGQEPSALSTEPGAQKSEVSGRVRQTEPMPAPGQTATDVLGMIARARALPREQQRDLLEGIVGAGAAAVNPLLQALDDEDAQTRQLAAEALGRMGTCTDDIALALAARVDDPERSVRVAAVTALVNACDDCRFRVPAVLQFARSTTRTWQDDFLLISTLAQCAASSREAIDELARGVAEGRYDPRLVAEELSELGEGSPYTSALLLHLLRSPDRSVARPAAKGLAMTLAYEDAVETLLGALTGEAVTTRRAAAFGLSWLSAPPPVVMDGLVEALDDPSDELRIDAARTLERLGPQAGGAIHALVRRCHRRQSPQVTAAIVRALGQVGAPAAEVVPTLIRLSHSVDVSVLRQAAIALAEYCVESDEAWDALRRLTTHPEAGVHEPARGGLRAASQYRR